MQNIAMNEAPAKRGDGPRRKHALERLSWGPSGEYS